MAMTCLEEGQTLRVVIEGEVDHHAAREMLMGLDRRIDAALPKRLELDMAGVSFMDSSGIALVLRSWKRMRQLEGGVELRHVPPQAGKVLRAANIDKLISFTD